MRRRFQTDQPAIVMPMPAKAIVAVSGTITNCVTLPVTPPFVSFTPAAHASLCFTEDAMPVWVMPAWICVMARRPGGFYRTYTRGHCRLPSMGMRMPSQQLTCTPQGRSTRRDVAIVIDTSASFSRGVLAGISRWCRQHESWTITIDDRQQSAPIPPWLLRWTGDGLISGLEESAVPRPWRGGLRPTIHVRGRLPHDPLPGVYPDEDKALRLALEHLVDRGIQHLAFCPASIATPSDTCEAMARHAESLGRSVDVFAPSRLAGGSRLRHGQERRDIAKWVASLPKPVGVIAASDVLAVHILETCRAKGFAVPDDVAVVGIGTDDILCELAAPALSSVKHDRERIGHEAARLLDEGMRSGRPATDAILVPPSGITVRQSSDILAVADIDIRNAIRIIQARGCTGLTASEVAVAAGVQRRLLDRKFQQVLGRTIHDELQRMRLAEAKRLLVETDHKLLIVSVRSGFAHAAQLCHIFKSVIGMSPIQYRKLYGATVKPSTTG